MAIALRYAARSDVGLVRQNNQDSAYAGPHRPGRAPLPAPARRPSPPAARAHWS